MHDRIFRPQDAVSFRTKHTDENGFIASIKGRTATVVTEDGDEYRVPIRELRLRKGAAPQRVRTLNDQARLDFKAGDRVAFARKGRARRLGRIVKVNPKYAHVNCGDAVWRVAYAHLAHVDVCTAGEDRRARLSEVETEADRLLHEHGLSDWRFTFDQATRRGGGCFFQTRQISVAEQFALNAPRSEVTDTLLHEIAHALVGDMHGHNKVWKAMARRIGCSAKVTHDVEFADTKWLATCPICRWQIARHRRRQGLVCRSCGCAVIFEPTVAAAPLAN
ncbi:MAG: hypothetical protein F4W90_04395 [Gammaproteobacteria bacterium]|nr:hypothetical protein [Gammaproteobacteria bacterium]